MKIEWLRQKITLMFAFLSADLAVYSGSMSFVSIFTFIPFLMLGVFAAVNVSFFAELFNAFREFLYANMFEGSADTIVYYVNVFLQNSSKLGYLGVLFALYSVFVFARQMDYCIHRLAGVDNARFGAKRFLKYFTVIAFMILLLSVSAVLDTIGSLFGFSFTAHVMSFLQMWLSLFLLFFIVSPLKKGSKKAATYSFIFSIVFTIFKKLFVYYVLFGGSYDTIYGPFATLFWFFVWLNLSWYILFASFKLYLK
jgi:membrane protein